MTKWLLALAFIPALLFSQSRKERKALEAQQKADQQVISNLKSHVQYLSAADNNANEERNVQYIANQFQAAGLLPKGTKGFIQPFTVEDGKRIESSTYFKVNDTLLTLNKEYFPLPYSAAKKVAGMPAMDLREKGVPWFKDIKDLLEENAQTPGFNITNAIKKEAQKVAAKGATALILFNTGNTPDGLSFDRKDKSAQLPIPVIYLMAAGYRKYFSDHSQLLDIELNVAFKDNTISGSNIIGYIDNAAPEVVVIGAYYNHSFTATDSKSSVTQSEQPVEDNNNGIAMLIELAKMLSASKAKSNNYLFIALGGQDKGSMAGRYWIENATVSSPINYMLNLDMSSSYTDNKKLWIQGYSSAAWNNIFASINDKTAVNIDSSGAVTDFQETFYQKAIPVLSFFTTKSTDNTNASDDSKINYASALQTDRFISKLVEAADSKGKIAFTKNLQPAKPAEEQPAIAKTVETTGIATKNPVSLGIIPDKSSHAEGLRINGITPKKLGAKIGLQPGDILTNLGSYKIADMNSYIQALSNFKTGDKTVLKIKRGKDDKEFTVEF